MKPATTGEDRARVEAALKRALALRTAFIPVRERAPYARYSQELRYVIEICEALIAEVDGNARTREQVAVVTVELTAKTEEIGNAFDERDKAVTALEEATVRKDVAQMVTGRAIVEEFGKVIEQLRNEQSRIGQRVKSLKTILEFGFMEVNYLTTFKSMRLDFLSEAEELAATLVVR